VIRRLVKKGLPVSCALTYMLAAPIVNPITALSTWKAFTGPVMMIYGETVQANLVMTVSRMGLGFLVAVLLGWVVARIPMVWVLRKRLVDELKNEMPDHKAAEHVHACCDHDHDHKHKNDTHACCGHDHSAQHTHKNEESSHACCGHDHSHDHAHEHKPDGSQRIVAAMRSAIKDFVDVGVYFSIGIAITALFNTGIAPGAAWLDSIANRQILAPSALMVLAFILSLCSTSDAFIAATLDKFTYGAKLAFLVFGPMLDLKLLFLYQTVLRKKFIFWMAVGLFATILLGAYYFQWFLNQQIVP
jgi:uncharacterized membrane protein YraQ (UPF0718 family)